MLGPQHVHQSLCDICPIVRDLSHCANIEFSHILKAVYLCLIFLKIDVSGRRHYICDSELTLPEINSKEFEYFGLHK